MLNNHGGGARNSPWGKPQVRISFRQTNHWQDSDLFAPCRQRDEVDPFIQHGCQTFVGGGLTAHIGKVYVRRFGLDFGGFQHRSASTHKSFVREKRGIVLEGRVVGKQHTCRVFGVAIRVTDRYRFNILLSVSTCSHALPHILIACGF